jgi:hypothetical protein
VLTAVGKLKAQPDEIRAVDFDFVGTSAILKRLGRVACHRRSCALLANDLVLDFAFLATLQQGCRHRCRPQIMGGLGIETGAARSREYAAKHKGARPRPN